MRVHRDLALLAAAAAVFVCAHLIATELNEAGPQASVTPPAVTKVPSDTAGESEAVTGSQEAAGAEDEDERIEAALISLGEFKVTHYCPCEKCCGYWATIRPLDENGDPIVYTASGTIAAQGRTIAVDPSIIPYGTEVLIRYEDGTEHTYIAEDCGGSIKENRIDVYMDSHKAALNSGVKQVEVFVREREG